MGGVAWTEEEDNLLRKCVEQYGEGKWHRVPLLAGINRCRKSCRLRWLNYLRPNINRGRFTEEEQELIVKLHKLLGNRWSLIAGRLPGRTANDVKNFWNGHLCKKLNADNYVGVSEQTPKATEEVTPWQLNLDTSSLQLSSIYYKAPPDHEIQPQDLAAASKQGFTLPLHSGATAVGDAPAGFDQMIPLLNNNGFFGSSSEGGIMVEDLLEEYELEEIPMMGEQPNQWDLDDLIMDMDLWSQSSSIVAIPMFMYDL